VTQYRVDLAQSYNNLGSHLQAMGRLRESEPALREALVIHQKLVADLPGVPQRRGDLALSYLAKAKNLDGKTLYGLARVCALASTAAQDDGKLAEAYAARALEFLRSAQTAGHFKDVSRVAHLKKDVDFAALHPRAEFTRFVDELQRGNKAEAK
jgi:hypothetical protein